MVDMPLNQTPQKSMVALSEQLKTSHDKPTMV